MKCAPPVKLLLCACVALLALSASAYPEATDANSVSETRRGPVASRLTVEPTVVQVGAAVVLRLSVTAPDQVEVFMPEFGEFLGEFSILDFAPRTTVTSDGTTTYEQRYELQVLRSGTQRLAPILIEFVDRRTAKTTADASEKVFELLTEPVEFNVRAISAEQLQMPLAPPLNKLAPRSFATREPVITGVSVIVIVAAISAVLFWLLRRRRRTVSVQAAHEVALARLRNLRTQPREQQHDVDQFYVELSSLVREFVEARFGLHAPELTTEEFLLAARDADELAPLDREFLGDLLSESDRVKFAAFMPAERHIDNSLDAVQQFLARAGEQSSAQTASVARAQHV